MGLFYLGLVVLLRRQEVCPVVWWYPVRNYGVSRVYLGFLDHYWAARVDLAGAAEVFDVIQGPGG
jgi:hypothetical protein